MAFVSGFAGAQIASGSSAQVCRAPAAVRMSAAGEEMSRRDLMAGVATAAAGLLVIPGAAMAGDAPKQSFFGGSSASSPFVYNMKQTGEILYKPLNDEDLQFHKNVLEKSRGELDRTSEQIARKSWDDMRGVIRNQMYNMRHSQLRLIESVESAEKQKAAKKNYNDLKKSLEEMDLAARNKKQEDARKFRASALKAFDSFTTSVGI
ncbi:hypothetical protein FVE85_6079 [Porphyridium purpureum]|uniref:Oxygen-evolving enhancer protein 3, chloroplastic n=1 Tax=Porphyridium purpureum TaxID=35688 RepID=A0A5J4Z679_PORPP|nr:Chain Q6, PsbQ' [Porphyridium purpureum]7Y5E_QL Chain QL, PsbQ' [Porphyridium purpureum]7Y5E_q6 Chain q6, PsbQ' [Porphyridium purpureum]7Y5E_qL Chain qL, PsbQ' [Porphyridium purpureum]7Y7A_Q9 Chain Q9, PsbQ' [Porphyridium purpureum]7Y7A_QE Chain QE, PsbQ' [Porphyridium purpureum]7Y7A_QO Chain QO, PsbQ' [Porphyridium purpureum]7Y7A_QZ Chain QZ, PsbQ' [Porphyridium purpureum]7Y7A_Qm Chain Qm, PsbQ' [Porphyridium purpureum]7Y7A_q9 Chain q9, PsbQ' [Porphyridium purpureum]7Y7A_qE Chain qE, |eukprot:POR3050..scf295_1